MNLRCTILHLEDDDNDSFLFERALSILGFAGAYRRVGDVNALIAYFSGHGHHSDRDAFPLPDVLVLDNVLTGAKLAAWLKENPGSNSIPRAILTGGMAEAEKGKWMERGIRHILQKGASLDDMAVSVRTILELVPE